MSDGENSNGVGRLEVHDVIRETYHGTSSDGQVLRNSGDRLARGRESHDLSDGGVNGIEELQAQAESTTFVPTCGFAVLIVGFVFKPNAGIHRLRNSVSARARTWSQGMPCDSPFRNKPCSGRRKWKPGLMNDFNDEIIKKSLFRGVSDLA